MATILQFNPGMRRNVRAVQSSIQHGGAEILLFTGIRYERMVEAVKADHVKAKAKPNKRGGKSRNVANATTKVMASAMTRATGNAAALRKRDRLELAD